MQVEWWYWIVAGLGMLLMELAIPVFVLVWFGVGALLVGILLAILPNVNLAVQLGLWLVVSIALVFLWFRVVKRDDHKTRAGMADDVIGEIGLLVSAVAPFRKGSVRFQKPLLGSDSWACIADHEIPAGVRVKVVQVEGSTLKVEQA